MEPVILETPRLILRPFTGADLDAITAACQDEAIQRWIPVPVPYTREDARFFVEEVCATGWREETLFNLGTFTRDGGELVSSIGLHQGLTRPSGVVEIGYWTAKEQRGHGYTAEAATAMCRWAFGTLGAHRLEWLAGVGNEGSWAVARKVGFIMEGTVRSRMDLRGAKIDGWLGSLLPSDLG
ncbi:MULTISPECIES: GNAT family N-acetyltransferase, partial [Streptacidiphilus]|uniref:GNAT family N-acetyltransferase n=1 Tax=Streptacidiphilus cavernicola TaxID=3342716 RepID=A0ABV6V167_9ACTN